ncbi:hypothetical protein DFH06DRAFT_411860 [Mycena polygramma]|nr:hypothetical protein DFH06DRAFT_411860 [Mycena polygramma]
MSRRARLFSEFLDGSDVGKGTTAPTASSVTQDVLTKRRKTSGLNSRFDRMIETMNVTHCPVRNRARSTSSTSGSSVPRTPIDDYDEFHRDGRLGAGFSVLKMTKSTESIPKRKRPAQVFPWDQDSSSSDSAEPPPPVPLPAWLADTFSTLATKHPLRLLLPRRTNTDPTPSPPRTVQDAENDSPFAFCAADPISPPANEPENDPEPYAQSTQTPPRLTEPASTYRPPSLPDTAFDVAPPFSTPGPGSVVSRSILPDPMPPVSFPEPTYCVFPSLSKPQIHCPEPTYPSYTPSFMQPLLPAGFSTENIKPPPADYEEYADLPTHLASIDVFSTPGPGYRTVPPVYFDSPTEDPSDSDPLEPGYEIGALDFRWEPFIQNEKDRTPASKSPPAVPDAAVSNEDDYYYEIQVEPDGEDDKDGQLYASINMGPTRYMSPGPFSFAPPADDFVPPTDTESPRQTQNATTTPDPPASPFFAPVPGIFISPLRGEQAPHTPPKVVEPAEGSQTWNDPIEDWEDNAGY